MSAHQDCPSCQWGNHDDHDASWGVIPDTLGGRVCVCIGDCKKRVAAMRAQVDAVFGFPPWDDE